MLNFLMSNREIWEYGGTFLQDILVRLSEISSLAIPLCTGQYMTLVWFNYFHPVFSYFPWLLCHDSFLQRQSPIGALKKDVLRIFTKFTRNNLYRVSLLKKILWHRCFLVNFVNFLRTPFYIEHLWWLLLFLLYVFKAFIFNFE